MMRAAVEWSYVPWRDRPGLAGRAALAAVASVALVAVLTEQWLPRVALGGAVGLTFLSACLPVHCRMDEAGVTCRTMFGTARRAWDQVRRARVRRGGVLLSPFRERHWLEPFRDLHLPLPPLGRDGLVEQIRPLLGAHGL